MMTPEKPRVLLVSPHPDDESIYFGGVMAEEATRADVFIIQLTDGALGKVAVYNKEGELTGTRLVESDEKQKFIDQRQAECKEAVEILGIPKEHVIFMNIPDQGINPNAIPKLVGVMKDINPHTIYSFSEAGTTSPHNADHSWSGIVTYLALYRILQDQLGPIKRGQAYVLSEPPAISFRQHLTSIIPDIQNRFVGWAEMNVMEDKLVAVPVTAHQDRKRAAMLAHTTQRGLISFFIDKAKLPDITHEYFYRRISIDEDVLGLTTMHVGKMPMSQDTYRSSDPEFYIKMAKRFGEAFNAFEPEGVIYQQASSPLNLPNAI